VKLQPDWRAIESEVPDLTIRSVIRLGEGWTATAYQVNHNLVFKFPKGPSLWEQLDREISFLAYARPLLPLPVADHLFQIRNSAGAPHGYAVYRHVAGTAANVSQMSDAARMEVAATLAHFLRSLHALGVSPEIQPDLHQDDERSVSQQHFHAAQEKITPRLTDSEGRCLNELFSRHLEDPNNFPLNHQIVHADLHAQHILYANGLVTGILDWGDVSLGDPEYDFCYLYGDVGEEFVREVASHYGHRDPDRLVRKARYFWMVDQIDVIAYGSGHAPIGEEALAWRQLRAILQQAEARL
jgi:aminoglycoside 2''-phosphotransferase